MDEFVELSILFDFYGELLPEKMREIFRLYHEENLSLAEIAGEYGMSRQGVHENVRKAGEKLRDYEEKLGLAARFAEQEAVLERLEKSMRELAGKYPEDPLIRSVAGEFGRLEA